MNKTALGKAGLSGWRVKVADGLADPISRRTPLKADHVRAIVGTLFFALSVYYVAGTAKRAVDEVRG